MSLSAHPTTPLHHPQQILLDNISFQKGRLLGVGTFGKVYEAIHLTTGNIIAVKQIELKTKRAEETARAVEQEIRMMEGLKHVNIVRLLGFSVVERTMNVIMEFVPGNSLDDVLQTMGPLHESLIRRYVKQILLGQCSAVQCRHLSPVNQPRRCSMSLTAACSDLHFAALFDSSVVVCSDGVSQQHRCTNCH